MLPTLESSAPGWAFLSVAAALFAFGVQVDRVLRFSDAQDG